MELRQAGWLGITYDILQEGLLCMHSDHPANEPVGKGYIFDPVIPRSNLRHKKSPATQ